MAKSLTKITFSTQNENSPTKVIELQILLLLAYSSDCVALELPGGVWRGVALAAPAAAVEFWDAFKLLLMFFTAVHSRGQNYGGGLARRPSFLSHRLSYGKVSAKAPHGFWMSSCLGPTAPPSHGKEGYFPSRPLAFTTGISCFFGLNFLLYYVAGTKYHVAYVANDAIHNLIWN